MQLSTRHTSSAHDRSLKSTIDWKLIICYVAIVLIGWVSIYASIQSSEPTSIFDSSYRSGKQFMWMMISFGFDILLLFVINPKIWEVLAPGLYIIVLILLVAVIFLSKDVKGSHSWFELGPVKFQPAEVSKITTSLMLAMVMGQQGFKLSNRRHFLWVVIILGLPMLAILGESETGSMLVYLGYIFVLYREGLSGWWIFAFVMCIFLFVMTLTTSWWIAGLILLGICAMIFWLYARRRNISKQKRRRTNLTILIGFAAGMLLIFASDILMNNVLQDHQRKRIEVLLGLQEDPMGVGYNVRQSMIAIGSGGFSGKGFLQGTQTAFGFVPEQSTDFIFCTIGEEHGFIGCLVVIALYIFMIYRIITDADKSRSAFTRIYGFSLASCLFMHLFINVGMTVGLVPVIGIPLPMLSYGGSSLLAFSTMIFIFIALHRQENRYF